MSRQLITILAAITLLPLASKAQVHFAAALGGGVSYVTAKDIQAKSRNTNYLPIVRPNASLYTTVPITKSISFHAGAGYFLKGYNTDQTVDVFGNRAVFATKTNLHYLSIPLMASVKLYQNEAKTQLWVDGGMNYDIFLSGKTTYDFSTYHDDEMLSNMHFSNNVAGKLANSKYTPSAQSWDVNALDVAAKLQVRYVWHEKYSIMVYHIHSLYDIRATIGDDATSSLKARYTGISIGYTLF